MTENDQETSKQIQESLNVDWVVPKKKHQQNALVLTQMWLPHPGSLAVVESWDFQPQIQNPLLLELKGKLGFFPWAGKCSRLSSSAGITSTKRCCLVWFFFNWISQACKLQDLRVEKSERERNISDCFIIVWIATYRVSTKEGRRKMCPCLTLLGLQYSPCLSPGIFSIKQSHEI